MKKPSAGLAVAAAVSLAALALTACSHSPKDNILLQIINAPATLTVNQSVSLTASLRNDSSNAGVDWTCGGAGGGCGTFSPAHTAGGETTTFTAPATAGAVTITATATADSGIAASARITIVPAGSNALLNGRYVFFVQGVDGYGSYCAAGTIFADGNGNITGGQQDYSDASVQTGPDAITGVYSIGPDGRGSITLSVDNASLPHYGVETFSIALTSVSHALIIQFDGSATSSGSLDLQAADAVDPAAISGAFAFIAQGEEYVYDAPITYGGVLTMSASTGTISGGMYFANDGGSTNSDSLTGTVTAPNEYGRGGLTFSWGLGFAYYAVRGQILRLIGKSGPNIMVGGGMFGQGPAGAGATFSNASLTGDYVLFESGETTAGPMALAGLLTADGAGSVSAGVVDVNDGGTTTFGPIGGLAVYSIAGDGSGTLTLPAAVDSAGNVSSLVVFAVNPAINLLDPASPEGGGGALVMDFDGNAVGVGCLVPRSTGALEGDYSLNLQFIGAHGENDWVGQTVATGGGLTGSVDVNDYGVTSAGAALLGTYAADAANAGRWTGGFTVGGVTHLIRYYQASPALFVIVDVDTADVGIGLMERQ